MFSLNTRWSFVCCWLSRVGCSKADEQFCMFGQGSLSVVSAVNWSVWAVWGTPMSASSHLGSWWGLSCQRASNLLPGCQLYRRPVGWGSQHSVWKLQLILPVLRIMPLPQLCLVSPCPETLMFNSLQRINLSTSAWVKRGVLTVALPASAHLEVLVVRSCEVVFMDHGGNVACSLLAPESAQVCYISYMSICFFFWIGLLRYNWHILNCMQFPFLCSPVKYSWKESFVLTFLNPFLLLSHECIPSSRVLLTLPKLPIKITDDHHVPELNGQFSVLVLLNLSAVSVQLDLCIDSWSHHQESDMAEHTHTWSHHHIKMRNVFLIPRGSSASL